MTDADIAHLEALALSAWPALQTELLDGWVLRFADGYTKRANSISPLYAGALPNADKLAYAEQRFRAAGLPCVFKQTGLALELDALLDERGYEVVEPSSVQTTRLAGQLLSFDADVALCSSLEMPWFAAFANMSGLDGKLRDAAGKLLLSYKAPVVFGMLLENGEAKCCGFAVRQWDSVLLFDIVTTPLARRQGYARRLVSSLLAWGRETGATQGLLQVVAANAPAVELYAGFGFAEQYQYWYRRQPC
ncbi:GNAT family N-acetyltransferase [Andreprevotia chitinilytica]|uniref:GNAT family N-acetyltransferase n=1 Tax=Andreprevotia chitinilytica TaxID=396808 RepID=UPI0005594133|nr:GNAT family N-acetyltransferase [Andreprevotia chitinilytica]